MPNFIIGLGHRSEHGKDTVANAMIGYLKTYRPELSVIKMPWAWKLKDVSHQLYGWLGLREAEFYETPEGRALRNVKLPHINKTPVEIWIDVGTPAIREQVWDQTWIAYVKNYKADIIICPDTRFPNEFERCDTTVNVTNPRIPNREGKSVDDNLEGYEWDYKIINDTDIDSLRIKAYGLAELICSHVFPEKPKSTLNKDEKIIFYGANA